MGYVKMRAARTLLGLSVPVLTGPEGATQTFKTGAPVTASGGYLVEDTTDPDNIVGVAIDPATGTTGTQRAVAPWIPSVLFEATLDNSGASPLTLAQTDLYAQYGLAKDSTTGAYYVDQAETSAVACTIVEFLDPVGTSQGRVLVAPIAARSAFA